MLGLAGGSLRLTHWGPCKAGPAPITPSNGNTPINKAGLLPLLAVPVLWGSYNPSVRVLYDQPYHLDPSSLTATRTVIAATALMVAVLVDRVYNGGGHGHAEAVTQPPSPRPVAATAEGAEVPLLARTLTGVVPAGIELGMYNFLGACLQTQALQLTTATKAGFLVQLTAVLVPVLSSLAGKAVPKRIWGAACLALAGTCAIALDTASRGGGPTPHLDGTPAPLVAMGDVYLMSACLFYALATVRLDFYAPHYRTIELTAVKKSTLCAASLLWLLSSATQQGAAGYETVAESLTHQTPQNWALIVYSSLGPGALATYLQTLGQATVPATLAQVVFSLAPLWSALISIVLLGEDSMGTTAWGGSAAILFASFLATASFTAGGRSPSPAAGSAGGGSGASAQGDDATATAVQEEHTAETVGSYSLNGGRAQRKPSGRSGAEPGVLVTAADNKATVE